MKVGSVFYWETDNVIGHETRNKYHVFICEASWQFDNIFLYANKSDYGGGYPLKKSDYDFFTLETSYVDCNAIIEYSDSDLADFSDNPVGQLSTRCLRGIYNGVERSRQMPRDEKKAVLEALYEHLKNQR